MPGKMTPEKLAAMRAGKVAAQERREAALKAMTDQTAEDIPLMPGVVRETQTPAAAIAVEEEVAPVTGAGDAFERFLAAQDAETVDLLGAVQLRVIFEEETKKAQLAKKEAAKKAVVERAAHAAKVEAGLLPAASVEEEARKRYMNRKVRWAITLPEAGDSMNLIDEGLRINGRLLPHGTQREGTMAEYLSEREMMYRANQNELDFQGKGRLSRLRAQYTGALNLGGAAP